MKRRRLLTLLIVVLTGLHGIVSFAASVWLFDPKYFKEYCQDLRNIIDDLKKEKENTHE